MFLINLKTAFRSLLKQKRFSIINILGLAIGMAVCLVIYVFAQHETSYEKGYKNYENIHRLTGMFMNEDVEQWLAVTPYPLAPTMQAELPEVESATRINDGWSEVLFSYKNESFYEKNYARVDTNFFETFSHEFIAGNAETAFDKPENIVLSEKLASKLFGNLNPIGQIIRINNTRDAIISAVIKKSDYPSHLNHDILLPWRKQDNLNANWNNMLNYYSYVKLNPNTDITSFENKMNQIAEKRYKSIPNNQNSEYDIGVIFGSQPIKDIHLYSHLDGEMNANSHAYYIYAYILVGLAILLIAIINFMNLSTARSANRAKEVGVRKVIGATRWESSLQFLSESLLQSSLAILLAFFLAELALPYFNDLLGLELVLLGKHTAKIIFIGIGMAILVGLLAGIYPALFLSGFQPIKVLRGDFSKSKDSAFLRKGLVVTQFTICASLILFLTFVVKQVDYMSNKELGFQPAQVVNISTQTNELNFETIKRELSTISGVESVSVANRLPGTSMGGNSYGYGGKNLVMDFNRVDENFLKTLGIELKHGRSFTSADLKDSIPRVMVNEAFLTHFNIKDPEGLIVERGDQKVQVVGVTKNFHWQGFNESITPFVMQELDDPWHPQVAVRIAPENVKQTIAAIQNQWATYEPNHPIQYTFLDEEFGALYSQYQKFGKALSFITILILFTAILGLFGLAAYMAEQRNKEIGIRKVLGASVEQMMVLITKDFLKLVMLAAVIALPIGYLMSTEWLESFAYRTSINAMPFLITIATVFLVSAVTVGMQAWRAAISNPVESIRSE